MPIANTDWEEGEEMKYPLAVCLTAWLCVVAAAVAQPMPLDTPQGSPLWWTLSEKVSPEELRQALSNQLLHDERYERALREGLAPALPSDVIITFFVHPRLDPELVPTWIAFSAFATAHAGVDPDNIVVEKLESRGLDHESALLVLTVAKQAADLQEELLQEARDPSIRFTELRRELVEVKGYSKAEVRRATKELDEEFFAASAGLPRSEARAMLHAHRMNPPAEAGTRLLPQLRARLGTEEWGDFLDFLRTDVLSQMGMILDMTEGD